MPRGSNPKGLALLVRGLVNLKHLTGEEAYLRTAQELSARIVSQRAADRPYFCAGYDFFWEARAFSVGEFTPNMVVSTFAGQAFLDLYDEVRESLWLEYADQAGEFIEKELVLGESEDEATLRYVPGEQARVHNINLMGAAFLARLHAYTGGQRRKELALKAARHSVRAQREDGSWVYGEGAHQKWVDNFHTGFNLVSLRAVQLCDDDEIWARSIDSGLEYHMRHHFTRDMVPKYYDTALYPIDIHNFAQGIETFVVLNRLESAHRLAKQSIAMMWDPGKQYFYYQKTNWYTNRINYLRWSQAWMFFALTRYLRTAGLGANAALGGGAQG